MKVKSESEVAQLCLTLSDPMNWSPPGSSVHGIFQARVLEWGAIAFSVCTHRFSQNRIQLVESDSTNWSEFLDVRPEDTEGQLNFLSYTISIRGLGFWN